METNNTPADTLGQPQSHFQQNNNVENQRKSPVLHAKHY